MGTNYTSTIWNGLRSRGMSPAGAAGMMGNMYHESDCFPARIQGDFSSGYSKSLEYTAKVNNKTTSEYSFVHNGPGGGGYGLCQWTYSSRKQGLYDLTVKKSRSISDVNCQLDFLVSELKSYGLWNLMCSTTSVQEASDTILLQFEKPDGASSMKNERYRSSAEFYNKFSNMPAIPIAYDPEPLAVPSGLAILAVAQSQVGTHEAGKNDNKIKYNDWAHMGTNEYCTTFLSWCADQAGVKIPGYDSSCGSWEKNTISNGTHLTSTQLESGDIIFFTWGHVGIVESVSNGYYYTIEGNTTKDESLNKGYDSSNNGVWRKRRTVSDASGGQRLNGVTSTPNTSKPLEETDYFDESNYIASVPYKLEYEEKDVEVQVTTRYTADVDANIARAKSTGLLITPTLVESPYIMLRVGKYTLGSYAIKGSFESRNSDVTVEYPNYINSMEVTKVNGVVNQYKISIVYQIEAGNDPNLLDKIFSSVGYGTVYISYGDWCAPSFIYKEEEAIITNLTTNVDFSNSKIEYTLSCASNALTLMGGYFNFNAQSAKPSDILYDMMYSQNGTYHLLDAFPGFSNKLNFDKFIARDDSVVEIQPKQGMDAISYVNYLVTCMSPTSTAKDSAIRDGNYYMTICDDINGEYGGTYFTVKKVIADGNMIALDNTNTYEVDVGYPGDTLVTSFKLNDDKSWSLLYNYSQDVKNNNYIYNVDAEGKIYSSYTPNIMTTSKYAYTTETQKSWWTQMTQFPVNATLVIKGLLRPAMLMSYVRVNALFYGLRHSSSGLYIITKQQDSISQSGYRTTLSLTRIAGDLDVLKTETKTVRKKIAKIVKD